MVPREVSLADGNRVRNPSVTTNGGKSAEVIVPSIEDYLQMVSAEQKEYAEVSAHQRIAENNDIITDFQTDNLMEQILHKDNLNKAYRKVKSNKGAGGVDGMSVDELLGFLRDNQKQRIQKIKDGKYKPNPVRRIEIPKETKGEFRKLGVPTVVDRVFQQAITQIFSPIYEKQFSESSFGFRPNGGVHDALKQCQGNINDGYVYVVDMDLEKFFDTVCQSKLIEVLSRTIKDGRGISLIHKYLNAGVISRGMFEKTEVDIPACSSGRSLWAMEIREGNSVAENATGSTGRLTQSSPEGTCFLWTVLLREIYLNFPPTRLEEIALLCWKVVGKRKSVVLGHEMHRERSRTGRAEMLAVDY